MYVPLPREATSFPDREPLSPKTAVVYSKDFLRIDRLRYHRKRKKIGRRLRERIQPAQFDLVHAHYLFSAGGIARQLLDGSSLPYVVSIRNTDVNVYFKNMIHLRGYGIETMRWASRLVFLSPAYQAHVLDRYVPDSLRAEFSAKSSVVPNGVHPFWLQPPVSARRAPEGSRLRLIFVGEFSRNKNIETIVEAARRLREHGIEATLLLVGGGGHEKTIGKLAKDNPGFVEVQPWTSSREALRDAYRSADVFVMPSFRETFGMAYVEAMSQGLPVMYSKGQGIDGYFEDGAVGYAVDPRNPGDVADKALAIRARYATISSNCVQFAQQFSWETIGSRLFALYKAALDTA